MGSCSTAGSASPTRFEQRVEHGQADTKMLDEHKGRNELEPICPDRNRNQVEHSPMSALSLRAEGEAIQGCGRTAARIASSVRFSQ
jgi:hypothetical protein